MLVSPKIHDLPSLEQPWKSKLLQFHEQFQMQEKTAVVWLPLRFSSVDLSVEIVFADFSSEVWLFFEDDTVKQVDIRLPRRSTMKPRVP